MRAPRSRCRSSTKSAAAAAAAYRRQPTRAPAQAVLSSYNFRFPFVLLTCQLVCAFLICRIGKVTSAKLPQPPRARRPYAGADRARAHLSALRHPPRSTLASSMSPTSPLRTSGGAPPRARPHRSPRAARHPCPRSRRVSSPLPRPSTAPVSVLFVSNVAAGFVGLRLVKIPIFLCLRRTTTIFTLAMEYFILGKTANSHTACVARVGAHRSPPPPTPPPHPQQRPAAGHVGRRARQLERP